MAAGEGEWSARRAAGWMAAKEMPLLWRQAGQAGVAGWAAMPVGSGGDEVSAAAGGRMRTAPYRPTRACKHEQALTPPAKKKEYVSVWGKGEVVGW